MKKEEIKVLANKLMFDVNEEETAEIQNEFDLLDQMLDMFEKIDTDGVEEMIYPFDEPTAFFREDKESNLLSQDEAMMNAPKVRQGHVVVPKVVK